MTTMTEFEVAVLNFCGRLTKVAENHCTGLSSYRYVPQFNRRYVRIVREDLYDGKPVSQSAHCFVRNEDGSLWKPAGWKGPERNFSRGNVYSLPETMTHYYGT